MAFHSIYELAGTVMLDLGIDIGGCHHTGGATNANEGAGPAPGGEESRPSFGGEDAEFEWKGPSRSSAKFYRASVSNVLAFPPTIGRDMAVAPHELPRSATVISMLTWRRVHASTG